MPLQIQILKKEMLVSVVHYAFESLQSIFSFHLCHHFLKFHAFYILIFKEIDSMNTKKLDSLKGPSTSPFKFYLNKENTICLLYCGILPFRSISMLSER